MEGLRLGNENVYEEIYKYLSATGFLSIAFASGILWNKVGNIKSELDSFTMEVRDGCDERHKDDKEVLQTIAILTSKVEDLRTGQSEFRADFNEYIKTKIGKKSP